MENNDIQTENVVSDNIPTKKKIGIFKIILILVVGFFVIVLLYFIYRFIIGLTNATINGVQSLFAFTTKLANDIVNSIINGIIWAVTSPFKVVDDIIKWIFG